MNTRRLYNSGINYYNGVRLCNYPKAAKLQGTQYD